MAKVKVRVQRWRRHSSDGGMPSDAANVNLLYMDDIRHYIHRLIIRWEKLTKYLARETGQEPLLRSLELHTVPLRRTPLRSRVVNHSQFTSSRCPRRHC